jgi:glycosyltransferase involved in cell wall biosynthesis
MRELEKHGWRVGLGLPRYHPDHNFGIVLADDKAVHGWDIVFMKLIMRKEVADVIQYVKGKQKLVVDIDDYFEGLEFSNRAFATTDPKNDSINNREHYFRIIEQADAVITSTPFLYDFYRAKRKNVFLVRNGIDIQRWTARKDNALWRPTIGWVGATPWRSNDLETLAPFMNDFLRKHNLKFHHAGHTADAEFAENQLKINNNRAETSPMKPISAYPTMFGKIDIGLVPLNDVPFNHAKSYIKGLEYASAGVPFIASALPEYQNLADDFVGRVACTKNEWINHLEALLDPQLRKDEAIVNREIVEEKFSMKQRGIEWNIVMDKIYNL